MRRFFRGMAITAIAACWPVVAAANDQETSQAIAGALRASGQLSDYAIGVKYQDGTALIQGRVASEQQRATARALVEQMEGVTNVVDRLEIKSTRGPEAAAGPGVRFSGEQTTQAPTASQVVRPEQALANAPMQPAGRTTAAQEPAPATQAQSYNDPGDPLQQTQAANFAASKSRRFVAEPNYTVAARKPLPRPAAKAPANGAIRQVSQFETAPPVPVAPMASAPQASPMSFGTVAPGAFQLAGPAQVGPGAAPASTAGYHHARSVGPMYGPAMGGCTGGACSGAAYEQPNMPGYAWPSYAAYPNYGAVTYPRQYSPTAWPYIGPFYPYPQVPLGWRKVTLEWDDGWWWLDFTDHHRHH